jgi:hypothetical protein
MGCSRRGDIGRGGGMWPFKVCRLAWKPTLASAASADGGFAGGGEPACAIKACGTPA